MKHAVIDCSVGFCYIVALIFEYFRLVEGGETERIMKKSLLLFGSAMIALLLAGCGTRPYVDVESKEYATLQLIPKSETMIFTDDYYAIIEDFSKGCEDRVVLGKVATDSDTPSRVVKIPVEKPLLITAYYRISDLNTDYTEYSRFILTPEKNRHYIVEYMKKEISFFQTISDFDVYMQEGDKKLKISDSRMRAFSREDECR
jgi:hypothetical protein